MSFFVGCQRLATNKQSCQPAHRVHCCCHSLPRPVPAPPLPLGVLHMQGRREVALLLVQRGAPTLVRDARGRTPLEAAAHGGGTLKAALLEVAAKGTRCAACGAGGSLKQCSRCKATAYCGAGCQQAHWAAHRRTCREE